LPPFIIIDGLWRIVAGLSVLDTPRAGSHPSKSNRPIGAQLPARRQITDREN
jgi:hypothetical protein